MIELEFRKGGQEGQMEPGTFGRGGLTWRAAVG